jgi:hypothetical protein
MGIPYSITSPAGLRLGDPAHQDFRAVIVSAPAAFAFDPRLVAALRKR